MKRRMRMHFSMSRTVGKTHLGARCCHSQVLSVSSILCHYKLKSISRFLGLEQSWYYALWFMALLSFLYMCIALRKLKWCQLLKVIKNFETCFLFLAYYLSINWFLVFAST